MKRPTRELILDAARDVFAEAGWRGATTREIARRARVNEVTLFRHFGTKTDLFTAVIARFVETQQRILQTALDQHAPLRQALTRFAKTYCESLQESSGFVRTFLAESQSRPREQSKMIQGIVKPYYDQFLRYLKLCQERGEIHRGIDCEAARDLFCGMLFAHIIRSPIPPRKYSSSKYQALCVDIFVRGVQS